MIEYKKSTTGRREYGADMAQQVEHVLGKDEVTGSNPVISSKAVGQKVFCLFDPLFAFFGQKLAILDTLDFQGPFFIY